MSTMLEKARYINTIKQNIATAITEKGGTVTNDFDSFAQAITNLQGSTPNQLVIAPVNGIASAQNFDVQFDDINNITNINRLFQSWQTTNITTIPEMPNLEEASLAFSNMPIQYFTIPFLPRLWNANQMFAFDANLQVIDFNCPAFAPTDLRYFAYQCANLREVHFPQLPRVMSMVSTFYQCTNLSTVTFQDQSLNQLSDISYAFFETGINRIVLPNMPNLQNTEFAFRNCQNLEYIEIGNVGPIINGRGTITNCPKLKEIKFKDLSNLTENGCNLLLVGIGDALTEFYVDKLPKVNIYWGLDSNRNLSVESLDRIANALPQTESPLQIELGRLKQKMTPEIIQKIEGKGWQIFTRPSN